MASQTTTAVPQDVFTFQEGPLGMTFGGFISDGCATMTKPADKGTFIRMRNVMMNVHSGLHNSLVESAHALHGEALLLVQRLMSRV